MNKLNIKKSPILLSLFLILIFSNFTQYENLEEFSFDKLKRKKILFKDISHGFKHKIYDNRISILEKADSITESKIYQIKISNNYPIYHGCYNIIPNKNQINNDEYIKFYNTKININNLLKNNLNHQIYSNDTYLKFTNSINYFKFNGDDFILLSAADRQFYRNLERNYWILLKVKNKVIIKSFCFIDGYNGGKDCFGDFNNDGLLDYMNWNFNEYKISLYSLKNNDFSIDKKHYIKLRQSKEQKEMTKEMGVIMLYDLLDRKNSKWFYKL
ncbi:MAG: hypothetical protein WAM46_20755 [Flavobacterium sp.]